MELGPQSVDEKPLVQFRRWFDDAVAAGVRQPDAMTLATVTAAGEPAARTVLLRGLDERGFAFFTNLESDKARDLAAHARAALVFHWREIERQVRVSGPVERLPDADAEAYWSARPVGHRLGAWASPQSSVVAEGELARRLDDMERRFSTTAPPLPPFWGGYVVALETMELWQGRPNRLHDRVRYRFAGGGWVRERLAP
jgi:pyridoxamine 5'-phosphate oxidase